MTTTTTTAIPGYDATALWAQYNVEATVPSLDDYRLANEAKTAEMKEALECHADLAYGASPMEVLDLFPVENAANGAGVPLFVFIHGGYWHRGSKNAAGFMAKTFVEKGVALASVDYDLAPDVDLDEIVRQARASVVWLASQAEEYGIDRERIYVGGTSAGGHLAAMVAAGGWHEDAWVADDLVKGVITISGLFDLEPLLEIEPNSWLKLDREGAQRNSPVHMPLAMEMPVVIGYGADETDEFRRQSDAYAEALRGRGAQCSVFEITDHNHFSIAQTLAEPDSVLSKQILGMIEG